MPGFIDTHHHQFETALRSFLANGILINDGSGTPSANPTYFEYILLDVRPRVPAGGRVHQRAVRRAGAARRRRHDGARRLADPSLAAALRRRDPGAVRYRAPRRLRLLRERRRQRCRTTGNQYPTDAPRIKPQWFSSSDQLVHMIMGGEVYLGDADLHAVLDHRARSSASRSRRTSCRRSASARSWTSSPPGTAAATATSGSDRTTCSST